MPSTYTDKNGLEKIAGGEQDGTWGATINTNFDLIDEAISGVIDITLTDKKTSGTPNDVDITDGASSEGRNSYIKFKDGGDLGGDVFVRLTPNTAEKTVYIENALSGSQDLYLFQGTYSASRDFVLTAGNTAIVKFDGLGASSSTAENVLDGLQLTNVNVIGTLAATGNITGNNLSGTNTGDDSGVTSVAGGVGIASSGGDTPSLSLTVGELPEKSGALVGTDRIVGTTASSNWAETISGIPLSIFNNDSNWSSTVGTVTSVATSGAISGGTITSTGTITHLTTAGNKHIPTGGNSGDLLENSASGTAIWVTRKGQQVFRQDNPTTNHDDEGIMFTDVAITLTNIHAIIVDGTSVAWSMFHDTDRSASGTLIDANTTSNKTTGDDITSFSDATIPANSFVWVDLTAVTGSPAEFMLMLFWTVDSA